MALPPPDVRDAALAYFDGNTRHAYNWLQEPHSALGGKTPLRHAETRNGAQAVIDLLGRMAHGIPSGRLAKGAPAPSQGMGAMPGAARVGGSP